MRIPDPRPFRRLAAHIATSALACSLSLGLSPLPARATETESPDKVETVYVYAQSDGSVREQSSRVVLTNKGQLDELGDETGLVDIQSDNTFEADGGTLRWQAAGKEVQYRGTPKAEPPLALRVTYTLDGTTVSPAQLAGKSGHLRIRYDYENRSWEGRIVGGEVVRVYTPFVAVTTLTLPHDVFRNVVVENGKLSDGSSSALAIGYALPGLQESLGLDADDLSVPSYFAIEADVSEFELESALTIVTSQLLSGFDADFGVGELSDSMATLRSATRALATGSDELADALGQIASGQDELAAGLATFEEQAGALPAATGALAAGASSLASGISGARDAADGLAAGMGSLNELVAQASQAAAGATEATDRTAEALGAAAEALEGAASATEELSDEVAAQQEALAFALGQLKAVDTSALDEEQAGALAEAISALDATAEGLAALDATPLTEALDATGTALATGTATTEAAQGALAATSQLIDQGIAPTATQIGAGTSGLAEGLAGASVGAGGLSAGLAELNEAAPQVTGGIGSLKEGAGKLASALRSAASGSSQLAEGMGALDSQGIAKLASLVDDDLAGTSDRLRAVLDAADAYESFSGKRAADSGSVTFVYKLDPIEP